MAIREIELISPFIVPIKRIDDIAKGIVEGNFYGNTKFRILNPGDCVGHKIGTQGDKVFQNITATSDGNGRRDIYRLEEIMPGSNVALKYELSTQLISEGSPPICIYDFVSENTDRVRIRSVFYYIHS